MGSNYVGGTCTGNAPLRAMSAPYRVSYATHTKRRSSNRLSTHQGLLICLMCRANCVLVVCRLPFYCPRITLVLRAYREFHGATTKHGVQIGRLTAGGSDGIRLPDHCDIELMYHCSRHNGFIRRRSLVAALEKDSAESVRETAKLLITGPWSRLINSKSDNKLNK